VGNRNFIVGLFVSFALAAIVGLSLWLSGRSGATATATYSMYFERDVSGLMLGGPVFYLGVEVGKVTRMEIVPGDPMSVRVDADVRVSTPIDTGTWASLYYQGITGVAVINLYGDRGMQLPLKRPPGEEHPVIAVRDAGLAAVLADAPSIMHKLDLLLDRAGRLFEEENRRLVADTLTNLESLSAALAGNEAAIAGLPQAIEATLDEVRQTLQQVRGTLSDAQPDIDAALANLARASASLASLAERLDSWARDGEGDVRAFVGDGLGQLPDLLDSTRSALREIEKLMRNLRDDPSQLLYRPAGNEED